MMMLSSTSCRNVWLIHETMVTTSPDCTADGSETAESAANAYAHHIVPTAAVILSARSVLNRASGPAVEN